MTEQTGDATILTELRERVLVVTLQRPDRLNALIPEMMAALSDSLARAADDQVRAVVVTGSGRAFCAGADLEAAMDIAPPSRRFRHQYHPAIVELAGLSKPVLAAINGAVVGAGLAIAAAADVRIASETAMFKAGFADIGQAPDNGASYLLSRAMGYTDAFRFLVSGERWDAAQALAAGLVSEVVAPEQLADRAVEIAAGWAAKPAAGVVETKRLLARASRESLLDLLEAEGAAYDILALDEERNAARTAMRATLRGG